MKRTLVITLAIALVLTLLFTALTLSFGDDIRARVLEWMEQNPQAII